MPLDIGSYTPGGATIARFHSSPKLVRHIAGPIGSSKTTACCWEAIFTGMLQRPMSDGVRRARVGILRDTYRNLYGTTLKTWFKSFPRDLGKFVGSDDRPFTHKLRFPAPFIGPDGMPTGQNGWVELEVEGRALGDRADAERVEAVCRGWELSGAFIDEEDLVPMEAMTFLLGRVQRYPSSQYIVSRGVWGAFNKPDTDHWLYDVCVEDLKPNVGFFDQPGGLLPGGPPFVTNPIAENLKNLPEGYYEISAQGQPEHYIRRMLRNEWGASVAGEVIYPNFKDRGDGAHVLPADLWPRPRDQLWIGGDAGGTPAATIGGRTASGRIITYAELVLTDPTDPRQRRLLHGVGPRTFAERLADLIHYRFPNNPMPIGYVDPSAFFGADRPAGEYSWVETVQNVLNDKGVRVSLQPAPSNEIGLRLEATRGLLLRSNEIDGQPQYQINPSCRWLRRGFVADYKYEKRDKDQPGKDLKPQKTASSHVHDAEQYKNLGMQGRAGVTAGARHDRYQPRTSYGGDDPAGGGDIGPRALDVTGKDAWERRRPGDQGRQDAPIKTYGGADFDPWR